MWVKMSPAGGTYHAGDRPMKRFLQLLPMAILAAFVVSASRVSVQAAEWYVAPDGVEKNEGTAESPWDIATALGGGQPIKPGDTLWLAVGTYRHPNRTTGSTGFEVRLTGSEDQPIVVRAEKGARVTLDGGMAVLEPSSHLVIRDLEILVSENFSMPRRVSEPGSHPSDYGRPWGGLNIHAGTGCKYINLVIHDNAQGVSFWSGATDSELYGCLIYDNGWEAPDRGHGHAIYTQNQNGTKRIADCIMTGGYSYTMHAYGSSRAYVDNYLIEGNIAYAGGQFLIGGGRPSHGIRVRDNLLSGVDMRLGYSAPENEDCKVTNNVIVGGTLSINRFKQVEELDNLVVPAGERLITDAPHQAFLRVNQYDADRANLAICNWRAVATDDAKNESQIVDVDAGKLLQEGDRYRLLDPKDFYGKLLAEGTYDGKSLAVRVKGPFLAAVLVRVTEG
jgi:hypothetical protein